VCVVRDATKTSLLTKPSILQFKKASFLRSPSWGVSKDALNRRKLSKEGAQPYRFAGLCFKTGFRASVPNRATAALRQALSLGEASDLTK
jgi:hypothetical protein